MKSSVIVWDVRQRDLRRAVREAHVPETGDTLMVDYLAEARADIRKTLAERAVTLDAALQQQAATLAAQHSQEVDRAVALLTLPDDLIRHVLMASSEDMAAEKAQLLALAASKAR